MIDDDDDLSVLIDALTRYENQLNAPAYDGVLGRLPEWVPESFHRDFERIRVHLLGTYSHAALLGYIDEYIAITESGTEYSIPGDIMVDVAKLAHYREAVRLGPLEGLALLNDKELAENVDKGIRYRQLQSKKARKPRGKVGDDGVTINELIGRLALAREYMELSAKELWQHFISVLDHQGLNPTETPAAGADWKKSVIEFDFKDRQKSITGGQFANVVSDYRSGKKSG